MTMVSVANCISFQDIIALADELNGQLLTLLTNQPISSLKHDNEMCDLRFGIQKIKSFFQNEIFTLYLIWELPFTGIM